MKIKRHMLTFLVAMLLLGCSNVYDEAIKEADEHFNKGKFKEALHYYEQVLEEKDDAEIQQTVDQLQVYNDMVRLIDKENWRKAEEAVYTLLEENLAAPLDEAVKSHETEIGVVMTKITKLDKMLGEIDELLENKKVEDATGLMKELEESEFFSMVEKDAKKTETNLLKIEKTIEKEEQITVEKREKEEKK